jgi:hypothetical protein
MRLGLVTVIWAVVTAILVQILVEGGRFLATRRRRRHASQTDQTLRVVS